MSLFDRLGSRFPFPRFQLPQCWHGRIEYAVSCPHFFTKHSKCCYKFFVLTVSLYASRAYSLLYKQLLQYTTLKSFTVPSALLTKFPKKFHMNLLASDIIFTKLSTKTLLLWRCRFSHDFLSPFIPQTFRQTSHTSRMLSHILLLGWLLISYLSIPLKPSFF